MLKLASQNLFDTRGLPYVVQKAATDIVQCRTSALGGHKSKCSHCNHTSIAYNSCRNRHCPKCQFSKREQWILDRKTDLLPVRYFHVVFTVPHTVNPAMRAFPGVMYHNLFKAAWRTVKTLSEDSNWLGARSGMIALLHTWGQNLSFHPHLHCIIPQGGLVPELKRWIYTRHRKFLFPVRVMSALYRRYFIEGISEAYANGSVKWDATEWKELISDLRKSSFNVFVKAPFAGPPQVIDYLGRYSHRVAITNHRIVDVSPAHVRFTYKDYRDGAKKVLQLSPKEFTRRFLQHVLPHGFAKIRHYGILSNKSKGTYIPIILRFFERRRATKEKFDAVAHILTKYHFDIRACPRCHNGIMMRYKEISRSRGDPLQSRNKGYFNRTSIKALSL